MARLVLDLTEETTVCGDIASHVARMLDELRPGDEIVIRTRLPRDVVEDSLELLRESGLVSIVSVKEENDVVEVILRVESRRGT